jgi:hypothetical protein
MNDSRRRRDRTTAHRGCGGGRGTGLPGPAAAAPSSKLESSCSNRNEALPMSVAAIVPCKCRCRTCERCGPTLGWRVRQNMLGKAHLVRKPAVLTLTVDRSHFTSPQEAHARISEGGYVRCLMRLLGVKLWFWVLEFQTKTGDGWPHWHVLIDLADLPGGRLDLVHAWRLWRDTWKLGGLQLQFKQGMSCPEHAVMYATKYLTKMPEAFPVWVLERTRAIRFIGGCKALGSLTGEPPRVRTEPEPVDQMELPFREARTVLVVRMARCEQTANVFCVSGDCGTGNCGEPEWKWMGTISATVDDLEDLAAQGLISLRIAAVEWGDKELWAITDASIGGVVAALRKVRGELSDREVGYSAGWAALMSERQRAVLDRHRGFWERGGITGGP